MTSLLSSAQTTPLSKAPESPASDALATDNLDTKRGLRACDSCHRKKIKCDGVRPQCNWCQHHGINCTFDRAQGGRRRANQSRKVRESNLVRRMERIECLLTENLKKHNVSCSSAVRGIEAELSRIETRSDDIGRKEPRSSAHVGRICCIGYKLGDVNLFHGIPFLSREGQQWIGLRFDETDNSLYDGEMHGPLWQNQQQAWPSLLFRENMAHWKTRELPPRGSVEKYLKFYNNSPFSEAFPIADRALFPETIENAYRGGLSTRSGDFQAKACVFAFLAFASVIGCPSGVELSPIDFESCSNATQLLMPDILNARPSTEVVDTLMMLAVYQFCCGNIQTTDIILSLAIRILFMLKAHLYPGEDMDGLPSESMNVEHRTILHRRELFWICYVLDKEITFRTGRPPIVNDTSCDLKLPRYYWSQVRIEFTGQPRLPGDLRLSLIKSKAYEKLYSPHALSKSDAEILRDIRELDNLLETWRQSLPTKSRPTLSFSRKANVVQDDNLNPATFLLQLEYHHCMTTIHQASSRCKNWVDNHRIDEGLSSSLDLALEASRSLLEYFQTGHHHAFPDLFWVLIFYPLSAKLTLFCNIMLNPSSSAASSDLETLCTAVQHINSRIGRSVGLSDSQMSHLKRVKQCGEEVVRLCQHAVFPSQQSVT